MTIQEKNIHDDLILVQDTFGSEFIYEKTDDGLVAVEFSPEGDEVARYAVKVQLEKLL